MNQSALLTYDNVRQISKVHRPWKLRARVIALWRVPEHMLPLSPSSMDMVLIDNEVNCMFMLFTCDKDSF